MIKPNETPGHADHPGKAPEPPTVEGQNLPPKRQFGALRGLISIDESFFEPMTESELAEWE